MKVTNWHAAAFFIGMFVCVAVQVPLVHFFVLVFYVGAIYAISRRLYHGNPLWRTVGNHWWRMAIDIIGIVACTVAQEKVLMTAVLIVVILRSIERTYANILKSGI